MTIEKLPARFIDQQYELVEQFKLVGHISPAAKYPEPAVTPIGLLGGRFFAQYGAHPDCQGAEFLEVTTTDFVHHTDELRIRLNGFNYHIHCLFAYSPKDVVLYETSQRVDFFRRLLQDPQFSVNDPFVRLAMADVVDEAGLLTRALRDCVDFFAGTPLVDSWYKATRESLLNPPLGGPRLTKVDIPEKWQDLPTFK